MRSGVAPGWIAHDHAWSPQSRLTLVMDEELRFVLTLLVLAIAPVALLFWAWIRLLPQRRSH